MLLLFKKNVFIVVQVQFSAFSPTPPRHPSHPHLPPPFPPPLVTVHVSFIIVPVNPSPFSSIIPSRFPFDHCQPVLNFNVFAAAWMELESIMLSEISQAMKDK